MKIRSLHSPANLIAILALVLLSACANIVRPTGGERDTEGPKIVRIDPPEGTLNYTGNTVDFYFDEFLKPGSYRKEIFVSPVPRFDPIVTVKNKRLRVQFQTDLRDSTTYVLTLGTGIKDFNESNGLDKSYTYAFSTGDQLDTLQINGSVKDAWTLEGKGEMRVIVYPADELEGNDIFDVRPVYATETDQSGNFSVQYLKEGAYKIYAVADQDQSYSYNSELEMIALTENPIVDLRDTNERKRDVELLAFMPDFYPPSVKSLRWTNENTLHLTATEQIRLAFGEDSIQITLTDTFGNNPRRLPVFHYGPESKADLFIHVPDGDSESYDLRLERMMDTLGQFADTTVRVDPQLRDRDNTGKLFEQPEIQLAEDRIVVFTYFNLPASFDTSQVLLADTSGNIIELDAENYGFEMRLLLSQIPPTDSLFKLALKPTIPRPTDLSQDTLIEFELKFPDLDNYGNIRGEIVPDSLNPDKKWIMLVMGKKEKITGGESHSGEDHDHDDDDSNAAPAADAAGRGGRGRSSGGGGGRSSKGSGGGSGSQILERITGSTYSLRRYPEGSYQVKFFDDADGNGYFTPGSLDPYEMPEEVYIDPNPLEIRAKWDVEGYNVFPGAVLPEVPAVESDSTVSEGKQRSRQR